MSRRWLPKVRWPNRPPELIEGIIYSRHYRPSIVFLPGDWEKIDAVWNSKGFKETKLDAEPFIVTCLEYGNVEQAAKYVPSVNLDDRFHYAMQCGLYRLAAETAVLLKEPQLLMQVERKNKDAEVRKYIMMAFQSGLGKGTG